MGLEILQSNIKRPVRSLSFQASLQRRLAAALAWNVQSVLTKEVKDMPTPGEAFCGSRAGWPEVFQGFPCPKCGAAMNVT